MPPAMLVSVLATTFSAELELLTRPYCFLKKKKMKKKTDNLLCSKAFFLNKGSFIHQ